MMHVTMNELSACIIVSFDRKYFSKVKTFEFQVPVKLAEAESDKAKY